MSNRVTLAQISEMSVEELSKLDPELIAFLLEEVAALKAQAKSADDLIHSALNLRYAEKAAETRKAKNTDTGTVRFQDGECTIVADLPKKIDWDQSGLAQVEKTLADMGEPVAEYIKLKRDVSENAYKGWPSSLKKMFDAYRTVGAGKPTYKIILKEG
jgi:hypothetical protein